MHKEEKRTHDRMPTFLYVTLSDGKRFLKEFVHNVSPGGLMIKSSEPLRVGTLLDMVIYARIPLEAKATVAWVRKDKYDYNIGVRINEMNSNPAAGWVDVLRGISQQEVRD